MTPKQPLKCAGDKLRELLEDALKAQSVAIGQPLEWSEDEQTMLDAACDAANRREDLRKAYLSERDGQARPTVVIKLSAELRALDRQIVDLVARVNPGLGQSKSAKHQHAANTRWARERERRGTA